ncbi:GNAT family N-acetyltransferase [Idiomarina ramblicola]|uniref:GNAT family N-acetyltransferase n=1 Tax=Idiomarina ramblicola TaxID=263724 RepID=A0A432YZP9_9GAMM|nr:GNAT family N-acetyltransferase [Idiomarina ramblicola]RUO69401.1 GNAT family N-acetyltransferase [Idiomarina ramblicola]
MISYQPTTNLSKSADITYQNMRSYYERYSVDWDQPKIVEQISCLQNWDILLDGEVVGALRLEFDDGGCYLRDLQVSEPFQNKGIGAAALTESFRLARESHAQQIRLRVFKISSAHNLYKRFGFKVVSEDDRFFNMALDTA